MMFIISSPWKVRHAVSQEKKPNPGFTRRLMKMVLLDQIGEILDLPQFTAFRDHPLGFELLEGFWIGGMFGDVDHARSHRLSGGESCVEKRLAASVSRVALNQKSSVFPAGSTARER